MKGFKEPLPTKKSTEMLAAAFSAKDSLAMALAADRAKNNSCSL